MHAQKQCEKGLFSKILITTRTYSILCTNSKISISRNSFAPSVSSLADYREITRHVSVTCMRRNNVKKVYSLKF